MPLFALCNNQYYPVFKLSGFFSPASNSKDIISKWFSFALFLLHTQIMPLCEMSVVHVYERGKSGTSLFFRLLRGRKFCKMKRDVEMKEFSCHLTSSFSPSRSLPIVIVYFCYIQFTLTIFFFLSFISS